MKFLHTCYAWNSKEVSLIYKTNTLPTCLSLYNLICELLGEGQRMAFLFNDTASD
jgi:hypothetical protein